MDARVVVLHNRSAMRAAISAALDQAGCTTIPLDDCRSLASDLRELDPPDVIITEERIVASNPEAFLAARELFPRLVVVALMAPLGPRKPAPPALVDCELESPPSDHHLMRAVNWALELARDDGTTAQPQRASRVENAPPSADPPSRASSRLTTADQWDAPVTGPDALRGRLRRAPRGTSGS